MSIGLVGPLDWHGWYAEYFVEFIALGAAGGLLWAMGLQSEREGFFCILTLLWTVVALTTVPLGRSLYWPAEAMLHVFLCLQLLVWWQEARRLKASEAYPVMIMLLGMAFETATVFAKIFLPRPDLALCPPGGLWLPCYTAEPWHAFVLPVLMTLAMVPWWVRPWPSRK